MSQPQRTNASRSRENIFGTPRSLTAVDSAAPTGDAGWDVKDWDQILLLVSGNDGGLATVDLWRRFEVPTSAAPKVADTWFLGERIEGVGLKDNLDLVAGEGCYLVNTLAADRLFVYLKRFDGAATSVYIVAVGITRRGEPMIDGAVRPRIGTPALVAEGVDLWSDSGSAKALTTSYVEGSWVDCDAGSEVLIAYVASTNTATTIEIKPKWRSVSGGTKYFFPATSAVAASGETTVETVGDLVVQRDGAPVAAFYLLQIPRAGQFTIDVKYTGGSAPNFIATAYVGQAVAA